MPTWLKVSFSPMLKNANVPDGGELRHCRDDPAQGNDSPEEYRTPVDPAQNGASSEPQDLIPLRSRTFIAAEDIEVFPFHTLRRPQILLSLVAVSSLLACLPVRQPPSAGEPASGSAKVLFVAPDGNDSNPGTRDAPFQTISAAAARATAGDIVRVRAGTYPEAVWVAGEGSREQPIVFEAEVPGSVTITGEAGGFAPEQWAGDHDSYAQSGNRWVTLRGFVFSGISDRPAVRAATGWRIEDCLFEKLSLGISIRGHMVIVTRSIFQDIDSPDAHALVAYGARNLRLTDLLIQRVNQQRLIKAIANSAVVKLLDTEGLLIERVVSRDNVGPGLWLDYNNRNFVIRQNYLSGNRGDRHAWEGPGLWVEINASANGQIYENTITDNSGAGIEIMESSNIDVYNNTLLNNDICIALRNMNRGAENQLRDIRIHSNLCGEPRRAGIVTGIGEWAGWDAASRQIVVENGVYLMPPEVPILWWLGEKVMTLQEATVELGLEANGVAHLADAPRNEARSPAPEQPGHNREVDTN